jgi:hypothetical protein
MVQTDAGRLRADRLDGRPEGANADAEAQAAIAMAWTMCIDPFPSGQRSKTLPLDEKDFEGGRGEGRSEQSFQGVSRLLS